MNNRAELLYRKKRSDLCENVCRDIFPYIAGTATKDELRRAARSTTMRRIKVFHPPLYVLAAGTWKG